MKSLRMVLALLALSLAALACNYPTLQPSPPVTVTPYVPEVEGTSAPPPSPSPLPEPTPVVEEPELTTEPGSPTPEPSPTENGTPSVTPTVPVSTGPLNFEAPNNPIGWEDVGGGQYEVSIAIHVTGGAPPFRISDSLFAPGTVFHSPGRDYTLVFAWSGCGGVSHTITVESADGQTSSQSHWVFPLWCPPTPNP
ncbi:MAG: hypothetical protein JW900_02460 [Anaerolineae bacterium]|nr:hypothetical protein [Anaerolineae bacterium]